MYLTLADVVRHQRGIEQYLHHRRAALAVLARQQLLRHHRFQVEREVHPDLVVQLRREKALDPVQRLVGVVGVQCTQAEMAGLGEGQGLGHGFGGAHLADHDDVGRLPQGIFQRHIERFRIHAHFALGHNAVAVFVDEFDRVFDADNVAVAVLVAITDHGRQGGGFTGAGRPHEYDQAALGHGQFLDDGGQPQFINAGDFSLDAPHYQPALAALDKGAGAEAAQPLVGEGVITLMMPQEGFLLVRAHGG